MFTSKPILALSFDTGVGTCDVAVLDVEVIGGAAAGVASRRRARLTASALRADVGALSGVTAITWVRRQFVSMGQLLTCIQTVCVWLVVGC